jgi:hypothetical protein
MLIAALDAEFQVAGLVRRALPATPNVAGERPIRLRAQVIERGATCYCASATFAPVSPNGHSTSQRR